MATETDFLTALKTNVDSLKSATTYLVNNAKWAAYLQTTIAGQIAAEQARIAGTSPPPPPPPPTGAIQFGPNADLGGVLLFNSTSWWNRDVSKIAVLSDSAAILAGAHPWGVHPDFGALYQGNPNGIPYNVVPATQKMQPVNLNLYSDDCDPGPYPIPNDVQIESGSDHHVCVVQVNADGKTLGGLFEMFSVSGSPPGGLSGFGCKFDASGGDLQRAYHKTSADAAGMPILPGLVKYDEVARAVKSGGDCGHAFRFTIAPGYCKLATRGMATHAAGPGGGTAAFGLHVRMRADFDLSKYSPEVQAIGRTLKKYGMINADNGGNWYLSGAPDQRWDDSALAAMSGFSNCWECIDNGPERPYTP